MITALNSYAIPVLIFSWLRSTVIGVTGRKIISQKTTVSSCSPPPFRFLSFSDVNCTIPIVDNSIPSEGSYTMSGQCQFFQDALYQVSCEKDILMFRPCFPTNYIQHNKSYVLNTCLPYGTTNSSSSVNYTQSIRVTGYCPTSIDQSTHTMVSANGLGRTMYAAGSTHLVNDTLCTSSPSIAPTAKPVYVKPAASVVLPTPPLPPNSFADSPLDVDLAHEIVYLAGRLIYRIQNTSDAISLVPSSYTYHLYKDTGSAEVWILSTENTNVTAGKILVIFRGTDDTPDGDWLTNLDSPKVLYGPEGKVLRATVTVPNVLGMDTTYELKVHQGFNRVMNSMYETVLSTVLPLLERVTNEGNPYYNNTIHFGGHSLGGARAQIMGTYFAFFHPAVRTYVTTLGSPRQGNYAYKVLVESLPNLSVWRMVNCRDVVPRIPLFQYYHAGHAMWKHCDPPSLDNSNLSQKHVVEAYYRDSGDLDQGYRKLPLSYVIRQNEPTMIHDHLGGNYMEWLEYARNVATNVGDNWTLKFMKDIP